MKAFIVNFFVMHSLQMHRN